MRTRWIARLAGLLPLSALLLTIGSAGATQPDRLTSCDQVIASPLAATSDATSWRVEWTMAYCATKPTYQVTLSGWNTEGQFPYWYADQGAADRGGLMLHYLAGDDAGTPVELGSSEHNDSQQHRYVIEAQQSGPNIVVRLLVDGVLSGTGYIGGTLGPIVGVDDQADLTQDVDHAVLSNA